MLYLTKAHCIVPITHFKELYEMTQLTRNLKKKNGFTLVEVIIVLVILAILAAILIPSLVGYIDKANEKASIATCRSFVLAAQTIGSETYGEQGTLSTSGTSANVDKDKFLKEVFDLAELDSTKYSGQIFMSPKGKVTTVEFYDGEFHVTFTGTSYNVVSDSTKPASTMDVK